MVFVISIIVKSGFIEGVAVVSPQECIKKRFQRGTEKFEVIIYFRTTACFDTVEKNSDCVYRRWPKSNGAHHSFY